MTRRNSNQEAGKGRERETRAGIVGTFADGGGGKKFGWGGVLVFWGGVGGVAERKRNFKH